MEDDWRDYREDSQRFSMRANYFYCLIIHKRIYIIYIKRELYSYWAHSASYVFFSPVVLLIYRYPIGIFELVAPALSAQAKATILSRIKMRGQK